MDLVVLRILITLILIPLMGISPRYHAANLALEKARLAWTNSSPSGAWKNIAIALEYLPQRADLWEKSGSYALQSGDPSAAITCFTRADQLEGLSPTGFIAWGDAAMQIGDLESAIELWQTALGLTGPSADLYFRLAQVHRRLRDYSATIADLQALAELEPDDPQTQYQLGLLTSVFLPELAQAYLTRAAELDPNFASATRTLQRALRSARLDEDPAYKLVQSGRSLASLEEWDLALLAFHRATQHRPDYAEAWAFLGEALQHIPSSDPSNRLDESRYALEKAVQLDPQSIAANTLLSLYWQRQDRYEMSLVYLHSALDLTPNNPAISIELGNVLAWLGNLSRAVTYLQRATELAPRDPTVWRSLASFSLSYEYEVRQIGLPAARQAILLAPEDPASSDMMGQIFTILDDPLSARRFFQRALQIDPGYAPARLHLGLLLLLEGDSIQARDQLLLAQQLSGKNTNTAEQATRLLQRYFP